MIKGKIQAITSQCKDFVHVNSASGNATETAYMPPKPSRHDDIVSLTCENINGMRKCCFLKQENIWYFSDIDIITNSLLHRVNTKK